MADQGDYMPPLTEDIQQSVSDMDKMVQSYLTTISAKEQEVLLLQEKIRMLKDNLSQAVSSTIQDTPLGWVKSICTELYWNYDEPAVRRGICLGLGLKPNVALGNRVYNAFYELTCACGETYRHPIKSRSDERFTPPTMCDKCKENEAIEREKQRKQQRIEAENTLSALKSIPYVEYLKTEHWQNLRKRSLKRAGYRCQTCNAKGILHVHHRTYVRRGEEELSDLIVLCANCHSTFHNVHEVTNE